LIDDQIHGIYPLRKIFLTVVVLMVGTKIFHAKLIKVEVEIQGLRWFRLVVWLLVEGSEEFVVR